MSDQPDNHALVYLRRLDTNVAALHEEMRDLKNRVTAVELGVASLRREIATLAEGQAFLVVRIDKLQQRVEGIERLLDLLRRARGANARTGLA